MTEVKQTQERAAEDIVGAIVKNYQHDNSERLKKKLMECYHFVDKTSGKGIDTLTKAGNYAAEAEQKIGFDAHPKTASFQGFISGYSLAEQELKAEIERLKELIETAFNYAYNEGYRDHKYQTKLKEPPFNQFKTDNNL